MAVPIGMIFYDGKMLEVGLRLDCHIKIRISIDGNPCAARMSLPTMANVLIHSFRFAFSSETGAS